MFKFRSSKNKEIKQVCPRISTTAWLSKDGDYIYVSPVLDETMNPYRKLTKNATWKPEDMVLLDRDTYEKFSHGQSIVWRHRAQELVDELNAALKGSRVGDEIQLVISGAIIARLLGNDEGYVEMLGYLDDILDDYHGTDSFFPNS